MSEQEHTSGIWRRYETMNGYAVVGEADGRTVCRAYLREGGYQTKANARLIAAAPTLLAACLLARTYMYGTEEVDGLTAFNALENAIAKATEEAPNGH